MTYKKFKEKLDKYELEYKKIFLIIRQKDDSKIFNDVNFQFELNPDNFYYGIIRRPKKMEYSAIQASLTKGNYMEAMEILLEACWLEGDELLRKNDDYFIPIALDGNFYLELKNTLCLNDYFIEKESLTIYISKTYDKIKDIEKDIIENPTNYDIYKFKKPSRKDIEQLGQGVEAEAQFLYNLCTEGNKVNIVMNDDVYFCLTSGNKGSISDLLKPNKISTLKKN